MGAPGVAGLLPPSSAEGPRQALLHVGLDPVEVGKEVVSRREDRAPAHTGLGGKGFRCHNCGVEQEMAWPVSLVILTAAGRAFEKTHARCEPSERGRARFRFTTPEEWRESWDTGISSATIWSVAMDRRAFSDLPIGDVPKDPDDFGRCYRLLRAFPEWRAKLPQVADRYPAWKPLVERWDELTRLYEEELPTGRAPRLFALLQELRADRVTAARNG